ncbi:UNVERIFIED_CONTAM: hypothetical protein K2H54_018875, partial [Gekko kuhli]
MGTTTLIMGGRLGGFGLGLHLLKELFRQQLHLAAGGILHSDPAEQPVCMQQ